MRVLINLFNRSFTCGNSKSGCFLSTSNNVSLDLLHNGECQTLHVSNI